MTTNSDYRAAKAFGLGIIAVLVFAPLLLMIVVLSHQQPVPDIDLLSFPTVDTSIRLLPRVTEGFDLTAWARDVVLQMLFLGIVAAYYVSLGGVIVGLIAIVVGVGIVTDPTELTAWLRRTVTSPRVQVVAGLYALAAVAIVSPQVLAVVIEVLVLLTVGGTVFLLAGTAWLWLNDRVGPVATILVVYPLGVMAVLLPPIAAGLVSPTFADLAREFTTRLAIVLLDTVLAVGGLNEILRETFTLEGVGYVAMWVAVVIVVGWLVGVVARLIERLRQPTG